MPQIKAALAFGVLAVVIAKVIYNLYFHPLRKFPGPRFAAISRLPFSIESVKGTTYKWLDELHAEYGTVVRISPGELSTISPGAWKDIYLARPQTRKDPSSQTPPMKGADSLFTAHGEEHSRIRKIYTAAFTEKALQEQSTLIEGHVDLLIERLRREATKSKEGILEISKYFGYAALDIIADLAWGESFHGLDGDNEHNWIFGIFMGAKFGAIRNSLSHFYPLDRVFGMIFLTLSAKARARNYELTENAIEKRIKLHEAGISRPDFTSSVVGALDQEKGGMKRNEMEVQALAITIAGCQLTSVALSTMAYLLLKNPMTYERLRQELRDNFNEEREINVSTTQNLPYLAAVVNETVRIHHPTPIHLPRIIPDEGMNVDGTWIPGGTVMGMSLQSAQTSPRYWEDPLGFHPERFLSPDHAWYDPRFENDNKGAFRPFSIGNRNCLGGKVFLAEAKLIMARTVWAFDLEMPQGANKKDWMDQKAYLVFVPTPLNVKVALRSA